MRSTDGAFWSGRHLINRADDFERKTLEGQKNYIGSCRETSNGATLAWSVKNKMCVSQRGEEGKEVPKHQKAHKKFFRILDIK